MDAEEADPELDRDKERPRARRSRILEALCFLSAAGGERACAAGARRGGGMQTAKGKAEAQGRKAKVGFHLLRFGANGEDDKMGGANTWMVLIIACHLIPGASRVSRPVLLLMSRCGWLLTEVGFLQ